MLLCLSRSARLHTFAAAKVLQIFQIHKIFSKKIIDLQAKRRFLGIVCARTSVCFFAKKIVVCTKVRTYFRRGPRWGRRSKALLFLTFARILRFFFAYVANFPYLCAQYEKTLYDIAAICSILSCRYGARATDVCRGAQCCSGIQ